MCTAQNRETIVLLVWVFFVWLACLFASLSLSLSLSRGAAFWDRPTDTDGEEAIGDQHVFGYMPVLIRPAQRNTTVGLRT